MAAADATPPPAAERSRKPSWLRVKVPPARAYRATAGVLADLDLRTVCEAARCPNKGECFAAGTATFLIGGDVCTRACGFCAVVHARAALRSLDSDEPRRVAEAAARLGLAHVVVTGVTRDDQPDGAAAHYAATIVALRERLPGATVEVLVPDFGGDEAALGVVLEARPDVLNHNLETVPRLYPLVRPQAGYERSLELLGRAAAWARSVAERAPNCRRPLVKTGLMVGLGETMAEVEAALGNIARRRLDLVTIGQYLQPVPESLPVARYVAPDEFSELERLGPALGLRIIAAPFVRSSYRAGDVLAG
jgi:lipoic acid synthetase